MSRTRHHNYLWVRKSQRKIINLLELKMLSFFLVVPIFRIPRFGGTLNLLRFFVPTTNRLICTEQVHRKLATFKVVSPDVSL